MIPCHKVSIAQRVLPEMTHGCSVTGRERLDKTGKVWFLPLLAQFAMLASILSADFKSVVRQLSASFRNLGGRKHSVFAKKNDPIVEHTLFGSQRQPGPIESPRHFPATR